MRYISTRTRDSHLHTNQEELQKVTPGRQRWNTPTHSENGQDGKAGEKHFLVCRWFLCCTWLSMIFLFLLNLKGKYSFFPRWYLSPWSWLAHIYNSRYLEAEIWRITVPDQSGQKCLWNSISTVKKEENKKQLGTVACAYHPSNSRKYKIGLRSRPAWVKSESLAPK
jgi:hypothetical protein